MEELYSELYGNDVTIISNEFLAKYLSDTDPLYLKVFLFYLWKGFKENYTIEEASIEIDATEADIEKALKYWVRKKIIKKDYLMKLKGDTISDDKLVDFESKKRELINKNRKSYGEVEEKLLFTAEKLFGKTLTERQVDLIAKCYNNFGFDESIIYYLIEYCVDKKQTDARYMKTIAESWYEQDVKSIDDAKKLVGKFEKRITSKSNAGKGKIAATMNREQYNEWFKNNVLAHK